MTYTERSEDDVLCHEVSDEALEAAGLGRESANPQTHPFAIICIPFGPRSQK
ncbi:MAG: hypothetical protein P8Y53_12355 [Pseudolabrys sp.]|jgi:hypothetical protein